MKDMAAKVHCESHHWVSTNVPGLITRWVIQCSICEAYNVGEMNRALFATLTDWLRERCVSQGTK
jgi:hypothetical protein